MKTKLILIRHGETNKNSSEIIHLINDPEPLNQKGRIQVQKAAAKLLESPPEIIYSSLEPRAIESAKIISSLHKVSHQIHPHLGERNWGELQSKKWLEIEEILTQIPVEIRNDFVPNDGESWSNFEKRLLGAVFEILKIHEGKTIVIVSHGGAIRAMMPKLLNIPKEKRHEYYFDNASISEFEFDGESFKEIKINDISHLG